MRTLEQWFSNWWVVTHQGKGKMAIPLKGSGSERVPNGSIVIMAVQGPGTELTWMVAPTFWRVNKAHSPPFCPPFYCK